MMALVPGSSLLNYHHLVMWPYVQNGKPPPQPWCELPPTARGTSNEENSSSSINSDLPVRNTIRSTVKEDRLVPISEDFPISTIVKKQSVLYSLPHSDSPTDLHWLFWQPLREPSLPD